jgi:YD repeat-containing protein
LEFAALHKAGAPSHIFIPNASTQGPPTSSADLLKHAVNSLGRTTNRAINSAAQTVAYDALGRVTALTNALGSFTNK